MSGDDPRHGTYAGAVKHQYDGETPCDPCKKARAEYARNRRKCAVVRRNERDRRRARERALARLVQLHPGQYALLVEQEMSAVES